MKIVSQFLLDLVSVLDTIGSLGLLLSLGLVQLIIILVRWYTSTPHDLKVYLLCLCSTSPQVICFTFPLVYWAYWRFVYSLISERRKGVKMVARTG